MKKHLFILVLLVSIVFPACKNQCPTLTDSQKADIEKQILSLWDKVIIPLEKVNIDEYSPFLSSDEFMASYDIGRAFHSKAELTDTLRVWFSYRKSMEFQQKNVKVTVLAENAVLLDQLSILQVNLKDGKI